MIKRQLQKYRMWIDTFKFLTSAHNHLWYREIKMLKYGNFAVYKLQHALLFSAARFFTLTKQVLMAVMS